MDVKEFLRELSEDEESFEGTINGRGLTGDVKGDGLTGENAIPFLAELRCLMEEYRIDRIDVSWAGPWNWIPE